MLLCFCQKLQVPIFIGWVSFLLLLLHFCFRLACVDILAGPALICCVFCYLIIVFLTQSLLLICCCCVTAKSFTMMLGRVCFWLSSLHVLCVSWFMLVFRFFWGCVSRHDVRGNFPTTRSHKSYMPVPPRAHLTSFCCYCTSLHPYTSIHTHVHPPAPIYTIIYEFICVQNSFMFSNLYTQSTLIKHMYNI